MPKTHRVQGVHIITTFLSESVFYNYGYSLQVNTTPSGSNPDDLVANHDIVLNHEGTVDLNSNVNQGDVNQQTGNQGNAQINPCNQGNILSGVTLRNGGM